MARVLEKRKTRMDIGWKGGFLTGIQPKRKACQTYGRLQIQI